MENRSLLGIILLLVAVIVAMGAGLIVANFGADEDIPTQYRVATQQKEERQVAEEAGIVRGTEEALDRDRLLVGMVNSAQSPIMDGTFNQTIWKGIEESQGIQEVRGGYIEGRSLEAKMEDLETLSTSGYKLIIMPGFEFGDDFDTPEADGMAYELASKYKDVNYVLVDNADPAATPEEPRGLRNLRGLIFREDQAGFLAGYAGAWAIYYQPGEQGGGTGNVGVFGGMPIPAILRYMKGSGLGVEAFNKEHPDSTVGFVGYNAADETGDFICDFTPEAINCDTPFDSREDGYAITKRHVEENDVKIEFPVSGVTSFGALDYAAEVPESELYYVIGVDSDWAPIASDYGVKPSRIAISAKKNLDRAIHDQILGVEQDTFFNSFDYEGNLSNSGVGYGAISNTIVKKQDLVIELEKKIELIISAQGQLP